MYVCVCMYVYMYVRMYVFECLSCMFTWMPEEKRASDPWIDGKVPCGFWESNSVPLEEQTMLLTISHFPSIVICRFYEKLQEKGK